jgi:spermidine synthase
MKTAGNRTFPLDGSLETIGNNMVPYKDYLEISCCGGPGFKIRVKDLVHISRSPYQEIAVYDTESYGKCLFLDGVIQSSDSDHEQYDKAILRKLKRTDKNLLILGGGDGHTAQMALKLNPRIQVTVVELDHAVIKACEAHLNQNIFNHPNVTAVIEDVIHFMERAPNVTYDSIICDLTDQPVGYNDIMLRDFYLKIVSLSIRILKRSGWISLYAGCNTDIVDDMISLYLCQPEKKVAFIPSFGEPCFIVHGQLLK